MNKRVKKPNWIYYALINITMTVCLLALIGCGDDNSSADKPTVPADDVVAAIVNGEVISLAELNKRFLPVKLQYSMSLPPQVEQNLPRLQQEFLQKLIDKKLLLQQAKKKGITVDKAELEAYINNISSPPPNQNAELQQKKQVLGQEGWLQELQQELVIKKLIQQEVAADILVTEAEAKDYYEANPEEFQQPEQVRVRQIMVETEWEAEEIRREIKGGEKFAKLAEAKSLSPDGANGGDLGYFSRGQMPLEFDEVAFKLKKGEVSSVFKSSYGYHIFKLEHKREAKTLVFDASQKSIDQKLKAQKVDDALTGWLKKLKRDASIKINPYFINS